MITSRHLPSIASIAVALGLAVAGGLAPDAHARALGAAPALTIESKACGIGQDATDRSATITASAVLGNAGDHVSLRFGIQQRAGVGAKWKTVPGLAQTSDLGDWEDGQPGRPGLRYTKTINGLGEGTQYRVVVDARGLTEAGKVATRSVRRYVTCTQPLFTPTVELGKISVDSSSAQPVATVAVRNTARLPADDPTIVTIYDADTRDVLGTSASAELKGNSTVKLEVPLSACPAKLYVTVQFEGDDPAAATPEQSSTVACGATRSAKRQQASRTR